MATQETYFVHSESGKHLFKVDIEGDIVYIYKYKYSKNHEFYETPMLTYLPTKIFIGENVYDGYNEYYDGNIILLKLPSIGKSVSNKYVFIGSEIILFETKHDIIIFMCPVGNDQFLRPYAIDTDNNYYVFNERVVINNPDLGGRDPTLWLDDNRNADYSWFDNILLINTSLV